MTKNALVVLGYHGCDARFGAEALSKGIELKPSSESYDWLGPGVYFWENDPVRAMEWAKFKVSMGSFRRPFVIGAAIDLGNCLDLTLRENVELLSPAYEGLKTLNRAAGHSMPKNKDVRSKTKGDKLLRFRDCAVIRHLHAIIADPVTNKPGETDYIPPFDTVRGLFVEGKSVYPGGGFFNQSHTQIAVVNLKSIIGVFKPRT